MSRLKTDYLERNTMVRRRAGRPSRLDDVFLMIQNFIEVENTAGHAVTLTGLLAFLNEDLKVPVKRKCLWEYMILNGYSYVSCVPQESLRVRLNPNDIVTYYTTTLPTALRGVHPMLVFNVDEMGTELFADRKRVRVLLPTARVPEGDLHVGIPRSNRRCTLVACIALDGSTLAPTIITKAKTVNTMLFEATGVNMKMPEFSVPRPVSSPRLFSRSG